MDIGLIAKGISVWAVPVLMAIILHEVAHGWMAEKFGDNTARKAGRITLNPLSHVDPIGTVILPLVLLIMKSPFLFGWAKPVPVNFAALRNPKRDMIWVSLAGPGTNFFLALASAILIRVIIVLEPNAINFANSEVSPEVLRDIGVGVSILVPILLMLKASIIINSVLMVLNLIPVPPLDGGRVLVGMLPRNAAYSYSKVEPFGIFIVLALIFFLPPTKELFLGFINFFITIFSMVAAY